MSRIKEKFTGALMMALIGTLCFAGYTKNKLWEKDGASIWTDNAFLVVIGAVLAGLTIVFIVALLTNTIFPELARRVANFFGMG